MTIGKRWVVACMLAEGIGMTAAAGAARFGDQLQQAGSAPGIALAVVVAGGLVEGTALGTLQGRVLRDVAGQSQARRWLVVTVAVAGVGWAAASAPAALSSGQGGAESPPVLGVVVAAAALGAVMGTVLGLAQAAVVRGGVPGAGRWIRVSAVAWTPTMVVIFLGATLPSAAWPTTAVVPLGTATGLVAGAVLGGISAGWVAGLVRSAGATEPVAPSRGS